ncbi:TRAP transporter substrate-binding protein [Desertibaculum subflavum]|uniref:TRAP transporter substrate-binding protein n=1 Tax=Desertibaculum subflavum TaxID=2268458 RepID=UPI0034D1BC0A
MSVRMVVASGSAGRAEKSVDRRKFLVRGGLAAGAAAAFPAPAIAQGIRELKLVTSWPKGLPGLGTSAERIGRTIAAASGNRLQVKVFGAGEMVSAFEAFDAVAAGVADMYHSAEYYWEAKSPGFSFFAAVPFGLTADEMAAWIHFGGGQALWDELSASYGVKGLLSTNTGVQMGGWFTKEVQGPESYRGLRYRMPGLGGEVLRRLGSVVVALPGGEIIPALQSGAIDAGEWVGPWNDLVLGLHKVSKYYYYPGFHEPGTVLSTGINKKLWDSLTGEDRNLITMVAAAEYTTSLAEFNANNAKALEQITNDKSVEIRKFDDSLLMALGKASRDIVAEIGQKDAMTRRIYDSFSAFRNRTARWAELAERGFLNARHIALSGSTKGQP